MDSIKSSQAELRSLIARPEAGGVHLQLTELVARLFESGSAALRSDDGAELQVERVASYRNLVSALAPRLVCEPDLQLTGVCHTPDPWSVTFVVRSVEDYSPSTDTVVLEAVRTSLYPERRSEPRVEIGGDAIVTVHYGVEMVEQERVSAVLVNLSASGLAFASSAELGVGTQVTVDARLLAGRLLADVRIRWRGPSRVPRMHAYGCSTVAGGRPNAEIVRRLIESAPAPAEMALAELRQSLASRPRERRFLGRRARD